MDGPARVIFFARQGTLQTAPVDFDPELALDCVEPLRHADLWVFAPQIGIESQDFGGKLVCGFGAALSGQQTGQPSRRQRRLRLMKVDRDTPKFVATVLITWPSTSWRRTIS